MTETGYPRATHTTDRQAASRHARPPQDDRAADIGVVDGPQIELGMGRRRVSGHDLFLYHALVSGNDQTMRDLTDLRGDEQAALRQYAQQVRPPFVTEGLLDRISAGLTRWLTGQPFRNGRPGSRAA